MKIKETRRISSMDVRNACIKNEWYHSGDCKAYGDMLESVDDLNGMSQSDFLNGLAKVALDIYIHSDMKPENFGCSADEIIANILFVLTNDCTYFTYEVELD